MAKNTKKKSAKEKRVLAGALVVAGVIAAGSTFAWFTSKDEVTNRLSASAEYGVAIAENFQPPESWVPGQEINKDASAVNTGNVDAFVRMWLNGNMRLLQQNRTSDTTQIAGYVANNHNFGTAPTAAVTDASLLNAGLTLMDASGNYYKTLSTTQAANNHQTLSTSQEGFPDTKSTALSEVQAMQSGILAYAPTNAEYTYILNEETILPIYVKVDDKQADYIEVAVPAGTLVHVGGTAGDAAEYKSSTGALDVRKSKTKAKNATGTAGTTDYNTVYVQAQTHNDSTTFFTPVNVEYETFTPLTDGLYLFLRNEKDANQDDPEFSGYYRSTQNVKNAETNETESNKIVYYALNNDTQRANRSDYTVKGATTETYAAPVTVKYDDDTNKKNIVHVVPSEKLELYTAQYSTTDNNSKLKFYTDKTAKNNPTTIYAVYENSATTNAQFDEDTDIVVVITLANVGTTPQGWTAINADEEITYAGLKDASGTEIPKLYDASKLTFYYNDDLEAGDTTAKLVDKVKLYEYVTNKAYLAFDFDLNVNLESIQVTFDESGKEKATAVKDGWAATKDTSSNDVNTGAKGEANDAADLEEVKWEKN